MWEIINANEIGRLIQGVCTKIPKGVNTICFIPYNKKPKNKKATYIRIVATNRPQKDEKKRVRWTVDNNKILYSRNIATPTAGLTTVKYHLNHIASTKGGRYYVINIKYFYLRTPMTEFNYTQILSSKISEEVVK